jgi:hypothetical protein
MMTDAANEKIARRDMITYPSTVAEKSAFLQPADQTILEQVAPESRNLPQ